MRLMSCEAFQRLSWEGTSQTYNDMETWKVKSDFLTVSHWSLPMDQSLPSTS